MENSKAREKDLRYIKTEKIIEDSYLALKKEGVKNIKVHDLCQRAMINKSTFYDHYDNIDLLYDYLCEKIIKEMFADAKNIDKAITDTKAFVDGCLEGIEKYHEKLFLIFGLDGESKAVNLIEEELMKIYLKDEDDEILKGKIIFAIGGGARLFMRKCAGLGKDNLIKLIKNIFES